jgi:hypothetical protein
MIDETLFREDSAASFIKSCFKDFIKDTTDSPHYKRMEPAC